MTEHEPSRTVSLRVEGMGCEACVATVRQALLSVPGVKAARVDLAQGKAEVEAAPTTPDAALQAAVDRAGYAAALA